MKAEQITIGLKVLLRRKKYGCLWYDLGAGSVVEAFEDGSIKVKIERDFQTPCGEIGRIESFMPEEMEEMIVGEMYTVVIDFYSLGVGEIGKPLNKKPIEFGGLSAESAMWLLNRCIDSDEGGTAPLVGKRMFIRTPDGRQLAMNALYKEIYGVDAINTEQGFKHPMLRKFKIREKKSKAGV